MDLLPLNFTVLKFSGAWTEREYNNPIIRALHFLYRYAIAFLMYHYTITELILLMFSQNDIENIIECLFISLSYIGLCLKLTNFLVRKKELELLLNCFRAEICRPKDAEERKILIKYNSRAKWCSLRFLTICQTTGCFLLISPLITAHNIHRPLPLRMFLPYSISNPFVYLATYLQQVVLVVIGISLNVSFDSLAYGFNILTCGQLELLEHRLGKIQENAVSYDVEKSKLQRHAHIRSCVEHHVLIQKIVQRIESFFMWTIATFFFLSLTTLCTTIFQITKQSILSVEFFSMFLYLLSMLIQSFSYCWYGNELQLKSKHISDAVYFSNWTSVTSYERRSLLLIMTISQKGLILSYKGIVTVVLQTFMWILKTSYSAFNLLQQLSD